MQHRKFRCRIVQDVDGRLQDHEYGKEDETIQLCFIEIEYGVSDELVDVGLILCGQSNVASIVGIKEGLGASIQTTFNRRHANPRQLRWPVSIKHPHYGEGV